MNCYRSVHAARYQSKLRDKYHETNIQVYWRHSTCNRLMVMTSVALNKELAYLVIEALYDWQERYRRRRHSQRHQSENETLDRYYDRILFHVAIY